MATVAGLLIFLLFPVWMWWLWCRMKKVQKIANEQARRPQSAAPPTEEQIGAANNLIMAKAHDYDQDLSIADNLASTSDPLKDIEGRRS